MTAQREQYREFIAGNKPLCVIELRKDADTFKVAVEQASKQQFGQYQLGTEYHAHLWCAPEGQEIVLSREYGIISAYLSLLNNKRNWWTDEGRRSSQVRLGQLFGYELEDSREFANNWTPEFCQCSKCVGVANANPEVK